MPHHLPKQRLSHYIQINQINRPSGTLGQRANNGDFFVSSQRSFCSNRYVQIALGLLTTRYRRTKQYSEGNLWKLFQRFLEHQID